MSTSLVTQSAAALSVGLARGLKGLTFDPLESRDVQAAPRQRATGHGAPQQGTDDGSSEEGEGAGASPKKRGAEVVDPRQLPPCIKAEHAAGRKLTYQLHLVLARMPSSFTNV